MGIPLGVLCVRSMSFSNAEPIGRYRLTWWGPVLILAAGTAAFWSSMSGTFVLDDGHAILDNPRIQRLWPPGSVLSGRRPVFDVTLAINHAIGGLNARGYHVGNLLIHLLAAMVLYGLIGRTLRQGSLRDRFGPVSSYFAMAVALIWVVHPLQTQSVTYLTQRAESLMGLFYLLTLYCLIRGSDSPHPRWWYAAGVAACALGMGSKAVMVTAPVTVLVYDRLLVSKSFRAALRHRGLFFAGLAVTWVLLWTTRVAPAVLSSEKARATVGFSVKAFTPWTYATTQLEVVTHYLRLAVWPYPLCMDYGWPATQDRLAIVIPGLLIALLLAWTVHGFLRRRESSFAGAWFFLILLPTSSFIPIRDAAFEHRMYLPLAAVVALFVFGAHVVLEAVGRRLSPQPTPRRILATALVVAAVISLGTATSQRNNIYHSELTAWRDVVNKRPKNSRAFDNFGYALHRVGKRDEAIVAYRTAVELQPHNANAHCNLGLALMETGNEEEGVRHYNTALEIDPRHANASRNLGVFLAVQKRFDEAIVAFRRAIRSSPRFAEAYFNLCGALYEQGRYDDSLEACARAIEINPRLPEAHFNSGLTLLRLDRLVEAVRAFARTLELSPQYPAAQRALDLANEKLRARTIGRVPSP